MRNYLLSPAHQDYLKAIYSLHSQGIDASNSALAQAMNVTPGSATSMMKRLGDMGLIDYAPYQGVELTPAGEQLALEMIRHHRLIELFLHDILGIPWDKVHAEAEKLEHVISEELEEAIAAKLGHPLFDPHGDPIPDRNGAKAVIDAIPLVDLPVGVGAQVIRVRTQESERLKYLGELGFYPGARVVVRQCAPFEGPLLVDIANKEEMLAYEMARLLHVKEIVGNE